MNIIACLPNYNGYKDRYRLFVELAKLNYSVSLLLLHGPHPEEFSSISGFEQLSIPENTSLFTRKKHIVTILKNYSKFEKIILHDTFLAQLAFASKSVIYPFKTRKVLSLYSPNPDFLLKGHWIGYKGIRCGPSEMWAHLKHALPDTILEYISCRKADMILGNTEQIVNDVHRYYRIPKTKIRFLLAEQDTSFFTPGDSVRKKLNLLEDEKIILYVGNLQRRKGIDIALRSFELFALKYKKVRVFLIGNFVADKYIWFSKILNHLSCKDKIEIKSYLDKKTLRDYYRSSDLFFIPTRHEGCPRVVKEAMACGLPVLASDTAGIKAIDPKYESITVSNNENLYSYVDKMERCLFDKKYRAEHIESGIKLGERFKIENVALQLSDIYKELFDN